ncbi:GNAT family N-acetyltransferase [Piscinibacter sakaiensis]|uniref:GCN5-related N-acetyltransferase n=1 Tax=Piscinibacter sakaiensis TaxID=1547922 RepID=A0A0K8P7C1_PISS1|nr:GNAT family protein [Piscinibacter sakaiensis]GAP38521.1 GCN5-related N-acetyltransferase [Piscinibacter sakaiensis]
MRPVDPVVLERAPVRLEPLAPGHEAGLQAAAADGALWTLRFTSVPEPQDTAAYIDAALRGRAEGHRFAFAVIEQASGEVIGCTSYHDIVPAIDRLEIGWTWYARRVQRSAVNTTCKLLLMQHAFDTLGAKLVGWRTDNFNHASQRAIERLGARRDGVLRHHALRRDGTVRDTVMYSLAAGEWPEVRAHLEWQLARPR